MEFRIRYPHGNGDLVLEVEENAHFEEVKAKVACLSSPLPNQSQSDFSFAMLLHWFPASVCRHPHTSAYAAEASFA